MKCDFSKERIKQILLTTLAFTLILVGYLNYNLDKNENETMEVSSNTNDLNLGDVQLVNSEPDNSEGAIVSNEELEESVVDSMISNEVINTVSENDVVNEDTIDQDDYFEESRIQRDSMYSEMLETYQNLVNSSETPADQKAIAVQEISNITNIKNGIMISENLIKNKGFEDVVILVNNEIVSVVVKSYTLNQEQISKIQNIVERELNVDVQNINISNRY